MVYRRAADTPLVLRNALQLHCAGANKMATGALHRRPQLLQLSVLGLVNTWAQPFQQCHSEDQQVGLRQGKVSGLKF